MARADRRFFFFKKKQPPKLNYARSLTQSTISSRRSDPFETIRHEYVIRPPDGGFGYVVLFCSFYTIFVVDGILFSSGMFLDKIMTKYKLSSGTASIAWSTAFGMHYLLGPICTASISSLGIRTTAFVGAVLTTIALALAAASPPYWVLVLILGGVGGLGMCLLFMTSVGIVTNYFAKMRTYALAVVGTGTGLGTLVFANLSLYLTSQMTWAQAFLILASFALFLNIAVLNYIPNRPVRVTLVNDEIVDESEDESSDDSEPEEGEKTEKKKKKFWQRWVGKKLIKRNKQTKKALKKFRKGFANWCKGRVTHAKSAIVDSIMRKSTTSSALRVRKSKLRGIHLPTMSQDVFKRKVSSVASAMSGRFKSRSTSLSRKSVADFPKFLEDFVHDIFDVRALKNFHIAAFCLSGGLGAAGFLIVYTYEAERTLHDGFGQAYGKAVIALIGATFILWRLQLAFISEIPGIPFRFVFQFSMIAAGIITMLSTKFTSNFFKVGYAAIFSFGHACFSVYRPAMLLEIIPHDKFTNVSGINLLFMGAMSIPLPPVAGWFRNLYGNFDITFWISGGLLILSALVCLPTSLIKVLRD